MTAQPHSLANCFLGKSLLVLLLWVLRLVRMNVGGGGKERKGVTKRNEAPGPGTGEVVVAPRWKRLRFDIAGTHEGHVGSENSFFSLPRRGLILWGALGICSLKVLAGASKKSSGSTSGCW